VGKGTCTSEGCNRSVHCRSLCRYHYDRARLAGELPDAYQRRSGHCSHGECDRPLKARGLCAIHYNADRHRNGKPCSVVECGRPALARGWCDPHYKRWLRHGDPEATRILRDLDPGIPGHRLCTGCMEVKPFSDFNERIERGEGKYHSRCRPCVADEWQRNREINLAKKAALNYGITVDRYHELMSIDRCDICGRRNNQSGRRLHIDHCHETGVVRGILCHACNTALGLADDSSGRLRSMADYLDKAAAKAGR
jgi:hypothetical protein